MNYKVSVIVLAYNHEAYIKQALDSVINQRTDFKFEILVNDDCSSDNTSEIIDKYVRKYNHICFVRRNRNIGASASLANLINRCSGEYISCLEGDDFWNDNTKLQKQADFLDTHQDYFFCGSKWKCIDESGNSVIRKLSWASSLKRDFRFKDFDGTKLPCHPNTYMFRNMLGDEINILPSIHRNIADRVLTPILLYHGNCFVLEDITLSYRSVLSEKGENITSKIYFNNYGHFYVDLLIAKRTQEFFLRTYGFFPRFRLIRARILFKAFVKLCLRPSEERIGYFRKIVKEMRTGGEY